MGFWEDKHRDEMAFSLEYMLSIWLVTVDTDFDHPAKVLFVRFLSVKLLSLEGSHYEPSLGSGELCPTSVRAEYWYNLFGIMYGRSVLSSHCVFVQSFIYISMDAWMFILYFGLWLSRTLFCCSHLLLPLQFFLYGSDLLKKKKMCFWSYYFFA